MIWKMIKYSKSFVKGTKIQVRQKTTTNKAILYPVLSLLSCDSLFLRLLDYSELAATSWSHCHNARLNVVFIKLCLTAEKYQL